jgi:hypothetical protein
MRAQRPRERTEPALLPTFFVGTLVMVLAIVAMARIDNAWADVGAVAVLATVAGVLVFAIGRTLGDEDENQDDGGS